jgi:hypothetical protein
VGLAVPGVERLALDAGHRSTGDRPCLASCWLPPFLDLEGPAWPTGTTRRFSRDSRSDPQVGNTFRRQMRDMGLQEVLCPPRSPWQRAYVERMIGSIRREWLDHMLVVHETSLRRILRTWITITDRERISP